MHVILGAAGKAGRSAIRILRAADLPVRAVLRDAAKADAFAATGCEVAIADLRDGQALARALSGAKAVQVICPVDPRLSDAGRAMIAIVETIGEALRASEAQTVVAISDYGAQHDEGTGVTLVFHHLEARLRDLCAKVTFLRSAEHMQNWARLIGVAAGTGILPSMHHPLSKRFPTVSAADVGAAAAGLMRSPQAGATPRIVHIEGPRRYSAFDLAAILGRHLGRDIRAELLPEVQWTAALTRAGLSESYAALVADVFKAHNAGRIDAEVGAGEILHGSTDFEEVAASLVESRQRPSG